MNNLVHTVADRDITDWLLRLDAATATLMLLLSIHYMWIACLERRRGIYDRVVQGIVIVAGLTGWTALDMFWISMSRAALLNGVVDVWFVSSPIRLVVPAIGLTLAAFTVWWSSEVRRWQVFVGLGVALLCLVYPQPYQWIALTVYNWF